MRYLKKLIFLLPVVCLTFLLSGCHNSGNENGNDTDTHESGISQDAQVNVPDSNNNDDNDMQINAPDQADLIFSLPFRLGL